MLFKICKVIVLSLFISSCMRSSLNLTQGINSFRVQDYRSAFVRLKPEAEKGNHEAQYAVGYMYYYGQGVVEDRRKAWFWITKSAESGNKDAIKAVALLNQSAGKTTS